jgi:hypothetical protein
MNASAFPWQVQIQGWGSDLEHLARHFESLPFRVVKDERDGGFVYESDAFTVCSTSEEVLAIAEREFCVLSGVLKLARGSHEPLRAGAVYKPNAAGGRDVFVHLHDTLQIRAELGDVTVTVTDAQGNVVTKPARPPRTIAIARLAATDAAVAKAMRLLSATDSQSWVGLYRIYEVVEADAGGEPAFKKRGWGSAGDLKRFKHSANSVTVAGDAARHGKELSSPPAKPMSSEEATAYVNYVVSPWLASKGA